MHICPQLQFGLATAKIGRHTGRSWKRRRPQDKPHDDDDDDCILHYFFLPETRS